MAPRCWPSPGCREPGRRRRSASRRPCAHPAPRWRPRRRCRTRPRCPRPDLGAVHRRPPAGGHPATDQRGLVQRDVVLDPHDRVLVDHGVRGEGAQHAHEPGVLAPDVVAGRAVLLQADVDAGALVAEILVAGGARGALAAGRDEAEDDVVALLDLVPGPAFSTTPAPSWPPITGRPSIGRSPTRTCSSEWHSPEAVSRTRTSPWRGSSSSTSSISQSLPYSQSTAAWVFTPSLLVDAHGAPGSGGGRSMRPAAEECALTPGSGRR